MYKDSEQLSSSLVRSGSASESDLYTLAIGGLTEADYGNYSCVARNNLGTSTDSVLITGGVCVIRIAFHHLLRYFRQPGPASDHQPPGGAIHQHLQTHLDSLDTGLGQDPQSEHPLSED